MQTESKVREVLIRVGVNKYIIGQAEGSDFSPKGIHIRFDDLAEDADISSLEFEITDKGVFFPVA